MCVCGGGFVLFCLPPVPGSFILAELWQGILIFFFKALVGKSVESQVTIGLLENLFS